MPAVEQPVAAALRLALVEPGPSSSSSNGHGQGSHSIGARASLLERVDFEEAGDYQADVAHHLKQKYIYLNGHHNGAANGSSGKQQQHQQQQQGSSSPTKSDGESALPQPKRVLFPLSSVRSGFRHGWQVGAGMQNFGNTCYLNSTLQAVFHVSAFANWLASETHADERCHQQGGGCIICGVRKTLADTQSSQGPVKPWQVYNKLRFICRHLTPGRQEDAHEFLRYLVEAMEKAYLAREGPAAAQQLDQYSKETTPLNQILGGYLRSVVRCLACGRASTTFQHFQDLLVNARKASSIDEALETFFSRERLEDLGYKCEFCNKKVSATKQFYVERPPMVLCIALKRFSITGGKLTKHVQFRLRLSLNKYLFNSKNPSPLEYRLVSIVTHLGQSQNCGHYTAAGIGPAGNFYQFDDTCVREIPVTQVLNTNAYILFYELGTPHANNSHKIAVHTAAATTSHSLEVAAEESSPRFIGPLMPKSFKRDECNGKAAIPLTANGAPPSSAECKANSNGTNGSKAKLTFIPLNFRNDDSKTDAKDKPSSSSSSTNGLSKHSNNINNGKSEGHTSNGCSPNKSNGVKSSNGLSGTNDSKKLTNGSGDSKSDKYANSPAKLANGDAADSKVPPLVPYDSESSRENHDVDDEEPPDSRPSSSIGSPVTKATSQGWKVSRESPDSKQPQSVPEQSPNASRSGSESREKSSDSTLKERETVSQLQRLSHRGYGAPVNTWNGTHAQLDRQVFEDKKNELKRAADADDEIDHGRVKKMKFNHNNNNNNNNYYNNKYHNGRNNGNNSFQDTQNQINKWGGFKKFPNYRNFKHKNRSRFNLHYSRHHSNNHFPRHHHHHHHQQYNRNH